MGTIDRREVRNLAAAAAFNYACGYNDHRPEGAPYADPFVFVEHWQHHCSMLSRPSIQDAFKAFLAEQVTA